MPISADTGAVVHGGRTFFYDDPAERLPGWPGTNAILQSRKMNFTPTTLGTTTKIYTSSNKADIVSLANFYADWGATIDIEEGPVYRLTVGLPWDEFSNIDDDPTKYTLWEIVPQAAERDIFEVGIFSPYVQGGAIQPNRIPISFMQKGAVDFAFKNPLMTVNLTPNQQNINLTYVARTYLALRRLKADGVQGFTQTVRRSVVLYAKTQANLSDPVGEATKENVSPLVCTADLVSLYNVPYNMQQFLLPSYAKQRNVAGADGVDLFALAGYLVKKQTIQQISPNKIQLSQEFVWDEWLDSLYKPWDGNYSKFLG